MKLKRLLPVILVFIMSGCALGKKTLEIPAVDVDSVKVNLPERPTRNVGSIKNSDGFDYIDLYELSDFHGAVHYEPDHSEDVYIGLPKLANYFDKKRSENPGGTLLLSTGDMFQGSAESNLTRGYMVNYCMQYMGFDAMAIGNHEFDWSDEWLKKNAELKYNTTSIPYLGANILKNGEIPDYLKKSTIVTRGDYKIGVIGVIGSDLENSILKTVIENYEFVKYATIVEEEAARLRNEENCNAVVLLAHEDAKQIETLTKNCVDAVFGGHAHTNTESTAAGVPSLATKNYGTSVAHISLKFNSSTKEIVSEGTTANIEKMIDVHKTLNDDANITSIMNQYSGAIDKIKNIKVGKCKEELAYDKALKNICTRAMHETAVKFADGNSDIDGSKIIAAYHNVNGGIRDNIAAGTITYGSVYKAFPFDNEVVLIKLTGFEYIRGCASLNRLGIYKTFERKTEIKDSETYYIVATDFLAFSEYFAEFKKDEGGLQDKHLIRTGKVVREEVAQKIYSIKKVKNSEWATNDNCYRVVS